MYQQLVLVGNVGRDPEIRYTPQGIAVCDFSIAVTKRWGKGEERQEETTWFKVTVWRERAETASRYIKKGMKLMVIGEVKASAYKAKDGKPAASLDVTATDFKFLDSAPKKDDGGHDDSPDETVDVPF